MNHTENKRLITKRDAVIISIILVTGLLAPALFETHSQYGTKAVISVDGKTVKTINISNLSRSYEIDEAKGAFIEMKGGAICVYSSDCPDKICVNTGYISKKGERIVCLPKKLIIEIE